MNLYVVRHAFARAAEPGEDDAERPLTAKGRARFRKEVKAMAALKLSFDRIYHSPWLRAVQTAELLADRLDGQSVVTPHLAQTPGPALLEELEGQKVAVVGHQPWLGELCAWLVHGDKAPADHWELGKGGLVWLEGEPRPSGMELRALMPPKWLRRLG
ncbi:MAG: SixA phosphatase family protein [Polyangiales bacterium]